jgi:hypothetical protein
MMAELEEPLKAEDVRKTYRYLRMGMIGAVVLLAFSIWLEWRKVPGHCFQTSISAYYYTPVRAIFVGFLIAIGLTLIVYKGKSPWEDAALNLSGMLGTIVAVAPTMDFGTCWSVPPNPLPRMGDGPVARWVVANIENNFTALLWIGVLGLVAGVILAVATDPGRDREGRRETNPTRLWKARRDTWIPLIVVAVGLAVGIWADAGWTSFNTRAHGYAAVGMIVFLGLAIIAHAIPHLREGDTKRDKRFAWSYLGIAGLMAAVLVFFWLTRIAAEHTVFAIEVFEILLFGVYWGVQTAENWNEEVEPSTKKPGGAGVVSTHQGG